MHTLHDGRISLYHGDCLGVMRGIPDQSVDAIITDPPYGTTACKWDSVIPFEPMWTELKRIIKPRGAIVLFGSQPFTSALVMSNPKMFRYEWIWQKNKVTGFLDCKRRPLKSHENVCVFYEKLGTYNPQMIEGEIHMRGARAKRNRANETYSAFKDEKYESDKYYPRSIHSVSAVSVPVHPNQKPIPLLEYLIRTYTNPDETVLDFTFGSCTTGVAAFNTGRKFIGIERDDTYYNLGLQRLQATIDALPPMSL